VLKPPLRAAVDRTLGGRSSLPPVAKLNSLGVAGAAGDMGIEGDEGEGAVATDVIVCCPQMGENGGEERDGRQVAPEMLPARFPSREGSMAGGARVFRRLYIHIVAGR
jgi:hypothetical protein